MEDIYHLVRLLLKHNPSAAPPSTQTLSSVFTQYEDLRIARTSAMVEGARKMGSEVRVVEGLEEAKKRDDWLKRTLPVQALAHLDAFVNEPFEEGKSEI